MNTAFRRAVHTAFHQAVAFGTLSVVGALASVLVVTAGPAVFGVAYGVVTIVRRGSQHTVRETLGLFSTGVGRYLREGLALSLFLVLFAAAAVADLWLLLSDPSVVLVALLVVSLVMFVSVTFVAMHAVALVVFETTRGSVLRDAAVVVVRYPFATALQALVVGSLFVLGTLTMVGWALVGFAVAVAFSLLATDLLYESAGAASPLYG
jgi:hypothetical protein